MVCTPATERDIYRAKIHCTGQVGVIKSAFIGGIDDGEKEGLEELGDGSVVDGEEFEGGSEVFHHYE